MDPEQVATARATDLLRTVLRERDWIAYQATGAIEVTGARGVYRISGYDSTEILDPGSGRRIASACLQLSILAPIPDRIIAEYVLIRNDEDTYWKTANIFKPAVNENAIVLIASLDAMLLVVCMFLLLT